MHQSGLLTPNVAIAVGLLLATLMLAFMFVDGLSRPTNVSWMLIGFSLASGAAGRKFATNRPGVAKRLNTISLCLILASVIYTCVLFFR